MGKMSREGAKRVIIETAKLDEYQPTAASNLAFNDLSLGSRVHATLFASPYVRGSSLEVCAKGGEVQVKGRVELGLEDEVLNVVKSVPGVNKVTSELYSVPAEGYLGP
jgi:osmotically-inducible protein OsmY